MKKPCIDCDKWFPGCWEYCYSYGYYISSIGAKVGKFVGCGEKDIGMEGENDKERI